MKEYFKHTQKIPYGYEMVSVLEIENSFVLRIVCHNTWSGKSILYSNPVELRIAMSSSMIPVSQAEFERYESNI
ncbi:hypothetical protein LEP1GSC050_0896 [Leptospira broomii serovar Hurstbridge str. 5399]|uniref:Uncharacterized protein n=1 Tax=Leptospira broomii serovar Hurstbridge str. 5399 TaxID=1049789 RepID=T0F760_9LEPT|nr:hypothetical protein [Leptospira broomii]EQA46965.1 hypothetical protein LEP1GSC050_0896 [Leptospira broomii serovar Hurstbridge str. 5399]